MLVAESFTALGVGNGFPFCRIETSGLVQINSINVNSTHWDYWTTASGFNKDSAGSPTVASIEESRRLAMAWYWNLYKVNGSATYNDFSYVNITEANSEDHADSGLPMPPKRRANITNDEALNASNGVTTLFYQDDGSGDISTYIEADAMVTMLYKGPVTSAIGYTPDVNDEFIGFGIGHAEAAAADFSWFETAHVGVYSARPHMSASLPLSVSDHKYGTISLGNDSIHVVKYAYAENMENFEGPDPTADAETLTAASNGIYQVAASITSLEPYTYN